MHAATISPQGLQRPLLALAPVGLFVVVAAGLIVAKAPPPLTWLAPICFGAFASLILLWRSGAPVIVQSAISMLIIVELLLLGIRSDGLGMRNVNAQVSSAIESSGTPSDDTHDPAGAPHVSIAVTSAEASRDADELSRRIQMELADRYHDGEIRGDLKIDRLGADTRLALSWSVGDVGDAAWCGSTSVFADDTQAGIALLASEVARKLTARPGARTGCGGSRKTT